MTVQIAPPAPAPPARRRPGRPPRCRRRPAPAADQVHAAGSGPGLLREPRPAARGVRGPLDPLRYVTAPDPATRAGRPPRRTSSPSRRIRSSSSGSAAACASTTGASSRAGRAVSRTRRSWTRGTSRPGCRTSSRSSAVETPGSLHGPGHLQAALPARLRELGHGDPARAPPQPRGGSPPRPARPARTRPSLQRPGRRVQPASGRAAARSGSPSGRRDVHPPGPERRLLGGPPNFREYFIRILPDAPDRRSSRSTRARPTATRAQAAPGGAAPERPPLPRRTPSGPRVHLHRLQPAAPAASRTSACGPRSAWRSTSTRSSATSSTARASGRRARSRGRPRTTIPTSSPCPTIRPGRPGSSPRPGWRRNAHGILEKDGKPLAFTLITNSGNEERKAIMVIAQNAWRRLGVQVEIAVARMGGLHQPARGQARLRRGRPRLGDGARTPTSSRSSTRARRVTSQLNFVGLREPEGGRR